MKKVKGLVLFLLTVCVLTVMPMVMKLDVNAETYTLNDVNGETRFQTGYPWDAEDSSREMYYLREMIKDGDSIVVAETDGRIEEHFNVRLANLTIDKATNCAVGADYIEECYVLGKSVAAINGTVNKAYVYDYATCTFNGDVNYLEAIGVNYEVRAVISSNARVYNFVSVEHGAESKHGYDFASGKFRLAEDKIKTKSEFYSTTPTEASIKALGGSVAETPSAPAASNNAASSSSDYDAVPKTGDTTNAFAWLVMAVAFAGVAVIARKRSMI